VLVIQRCSSVEICLSDSRRLSRRANGKLTYRLCEVVAADVLSCAFGLVGAFRVGRVELIEHRKIVLRERLVPHLPEPPTTTTASRDATDPGVALIKAD
jgi:hypothetical protein